MNIVEIVDGAISRLPSGDHSIGLEAIRRHISASIRHFERNDSNIDCYTDVIYRTNQVFEGALKEAYRVLTGKDPGGLSPYDIETYLESNNLIRTRVLKQLTRYRQDYRNPSTHDYRLDFDEDEALLAIVSVCAFVKLLVNQISNKLAFNDATSRVETSRVDINPRNAREFVKDVAKLIADALRDLDGNDIDSEQLDGFVIGTLTNSKFSVLTRDLNTEHSDFDAIVSYGEYRIPVEIRKINEADLQLTFQYIEKASKNQSSEAICIVLISNEPLAGLSIYETSLKNGVLAYIVTNPSYQSDEMIKSYLDK